VIHLPKIKEQEPRFTDDRLKGFMTRKQVVDLLEVDLSTLWRWNKTNILNSKKIGGRVYYRGKDIEQLLDK